MGNVSKMRKIFPKMQSHLTFLVTMLMCFTVSHLADPALAFSAINLSSKRQLPPIQSILHKSATKTSLYSTETKETENTKETKNTKTENTKTEDSNVKLNDFFKKPVPSTILEKVSLQKSDPATTSTDIISLITSPPTSPGLPRPLWLVILASLPTGLVWYGYYKFCIEEELFEMELSAGKTPRGFGGYGTLGPFTYGLILGPIAEILHLPGGMNWSAAGIIFIYYTQFLLYDRVNELYREEGLEEPLTVWWCWPIFFPFNLIVGLRQVHFLSQYFYRQRGLEEPPKDPVAQFFPFISSEKFTWQEFLTSPRLWCIFLEKREDIKREELPEFLRKFLEWGDEMSKKEKKSS